jgi:U3 small nucleolar RNA-associated protein 13
MHAGLAVLPTGSAFPGVLSVESLIKQGLSSKAHFFATAGERGIVRIWRSDTGSCVYTYSGSSSGGSSGSSKKKQKTALGAAEVVAAAAGSELLELMLLPGGKGLLAATGDARLLFFHPKVEEEPAPGSSGSSKKVSELSLTRQLVGNFDEITDLAFVYNSSSSSSSDEDPDQQQQQQQHRTVPDGSSSTAAGLVLQPHEPRRLAVATNSQDIRLFELADASCVGDFVGHRDIVVCLDTVRPAPGGC